MVSAILLSFQNPSSEIRHAPETEGNTPHLCPFANFDTSALAVKIEKAVFPNNHHVKIAVTGCPNDCIKAHLQDYGIIGVCEPEYDYERCIGCEACVTNCQKRVTGALTMVNGKVKRDERRCIGCGECVLKCPVSAWTRNPQKYYRVVIMGRTGKKNPRLAQTFIEWADEESIIKPNLQVSTNNIMASHNTTCKMIDKNSLFYLMSKGLSKIKAIKLVKEGFLNNLE